MRKCRARFFTAPAIAFLGKNTFPTTDYAIYPGYGRVYLKRGFTSCVVTDGSRLFQEPTAVIIFKRSSRARTVMARTAVSESIVNS